MQFHQVKLIKTAASIQDWPSSKLPEIIFVGRSNAGKSTLINALVNRKNLAYTGKTPGKTRLLNFFEIDNQIVFTDAPGYGYATSDIESAKQFERLIDPYLKRREQLKGMVIVMDSRRMPSDDDMTMIEYGRTTGIAIVVALTKIDKLSRSKYLQARQKISSVTGIPTASILPCASLKKEGMDDLWKRIYLMANIDIS